MDNAERLEKYCLANGARGRKVIIPISEAGLSPAQRRRLKHKEKSRKTHDHRDLPVYQPDKIEAYTRRAPCAKCAPRPRVKLVGG